MLSRLIPGKLGAIALVAGVLAAVLPKALAQSGVPIPAGTWSMVLTRGVPEESNGWEQLVYASAVQQSIMLSQYHQRYSEVNESLVGYNFDTNSWDVVDMGGLFHTENMPEGGESQGYFGYNPNNSTITYYCCTSGSNQTENPFHTWWYDVLGQSGIDKHTSPKPPVTALQPAGAFDAAHDVFVFEGGDSFVGTWTYSPTSNTWNKMTTTNGTPPNPSLILAAMAYSTSAQQVYLFGGYDGTTYYSTLYSYNVPTNTWTLINPAGGVAPPGRYRHAFAYDSTNNVFLLYGGQNASGILGDTWIFNPATNAWTQLNPPQSPPIAASPVWARLAYDSDHNVFVLAQQGSGGYFGGAWTAYAIQTWLFRYQGAGPNAGTLVSAAQPAAGSLNFNAASWAKEPALASSGGSLYVAWAETGSPFDASSAGTPHIYASQYSGGNWVSLGSSYQAISATTDEAHMPSMTLVGGTPWISWYQSNDLNSTEIYAGSWNGSSWQSTAPGLVSATYQGRSQINSLAGVPYLAFLELDKNYYPQSAFAYVKAWNGTSWNLVGTGALNRNTAAGTTADSISITNDGTYPYVAWTEYVHTYGGSSGEDTDTNPQLYVSQWNGSQWVAVGGSLNVNPANWAYDASIAYFNGQLYVAWTERTQAGNSQLFVKTWNGASWVLAGSGTLNQNPVTGWAYHPDLVADAGTNSLSVGWVEQSAVGQKARVYVSRYVAGSWTPLGGSLNADPVNGSAQRVSIGVFNGEPVAAWGEVNSGWLRQVYVKQWNGSSWTQLMGTGGAADTTAPTTPTNLTASAVSSSQISLAWLPSTDLVGVTGYRVYRAGSQIANVVSTLGYVDSGLSQSTSYSYTVAAYDGAGNVSSQSLPASATTLSNPLQLTLQPPAVSGQVGTAYNSSFVAAGGTQPYNFSITSGSLPTGLTLNAATGAITGTPAVPGTFSFTGKVTDSTSPTPLTASVSSSITIAPATLTLQPPAATGQVGIAYGSALVATGGTPPYNFSIASGSLPTGLVLNAATGAITGTPSAPGTFSFTGKVTDSTTPAPMTASVGGSITIAPAPLTLQPPASAGQVGAAYSSSLVAAGGTPPYKFSIPSGSLPTGLALNSTTGAITGTPAAPGTFSFTAKVTDSTSPTPLTTSIGSSITIAPAPLTLQPPFGAGQVGIAYSSALAAAGGTTPYHFSITSGSLPSGLALNASTGVINGTPTLASTFAFTGTVTDSTSPTPLTTSVGSSITIAAGNGNSPSLLQINGNSSEVSGVTNGSVVTPAAAPAGFTGTVVVNGTGSVNFTPAQAGNGVYFLNCCVNSNNAYYKFQGAAVGSIFTVSQGQVSFSLTSRYTFAQRQASAATPRYAFDVRDGNGTHEFYFLTQISSGELQFTYMVGGVAQFYYVPKGTEDTLFGNGVTLQVTIAWSGSTSSLYLNNTMVKSAPYTVPAPNWSSASNFDLGAYEYLSTGGYNISDDVIDEFAVSTPVLDTTPPTVSMTAPANGATVGSTVTVSANATDNVGVAGVQFQVDGSNLGGVVTGAGPAYSTSWDTTTAVNGAHTVSAIASDAAGNMATSTVSVTVSNPPAISAVSATSITPSGATIVWTTNQASNSQVAYGPTSGYGWMSGLNPALVTSHSVSLSGLAPSSTYHYQVMSQDVQGYLTSSGDFTFTTTAGGGQPLLQINGNSTEVSGVTNGSVVTPATAPSGFTGTVVVNGTGSVNFTPAQAGNGVYFLNCCVNSNNAYYKFQGATLGNIFTVTQGQVSFSLTSRYTFAQRQASAATPRYAFDVRDGNGTHEFYFLTQISSGYLQFTYMVGGVAQFYYVPAGTENTLFGNGVTLQVTIAWNGSTATLYLNNTPVKTTPYTIPAPNWTSASNFDLGAYEYLNTGGYNISDDVIGGFAAQ